MLLVVAFTILRYLYLMPFISITYIFKLL